MTEYMKANVTRFKPLYVEMVERCRVLQQELLHEVREGNYAGMLTRARALHGQVGALCDLLAAREVRHG